MSLSLIHELDFSINPSKSDQLNFSIEVFSDDVAMAASTFGTAGTFGTFGSATGTAGSFGSAGTFGTAELQ